MASSSSSLALLTSEVSFDSSLRFGLYLLISPFAAAQQKEHLNFPFTHCNYLPGHYRARVPSEGEIDGMTFPRAPPWVLKVSFKRENRPVFGVFSSSPPPIRQISLS